jgi:hypothetical protein
MDMQVAKMGGKTGLLLRGDRLVLEEHHMMLKQGLLNGIAVLKAQRLSQVDTLNLGAQGRANRGNGQAHDLSLNQRAD